MGHEYRIRSGHADVAFAELKELCVIAGDKRSHGHRPGRTRIGHQPERRPRESSGPATELVALLESIDDCSLTVSLSVAYLNTILAAGEMAHALQLAEQVIDLADDVSGASTLISISPLANALAIRGTALWCVGAQGWRDDFDRALETVAAIPPQFRSGTTWIVYLMSVPNGVLGARAADIDQMAEIAVSRRAIR